jgi:hypothetical protein
MKPDIVKAGAVCRIAGLPNPGCPASRRLPVRNFITVGAAPMPGAHPPQVSLTLPQDICCPLDFPGSAPFCKPSSDDVQHLPMGAVYGGRGAARQAQQAADFVTDSNREEGFANAVERLILRGGRSSKRAAATRAGGRSW